VTNARTTLYWLGALCWFGARSEAFACATCYGASDSALAQGMNWGILVLLGFIFCVLAGVTGFFVYLIRRANLVAVTVPGPEATETKP